VPGPSPALLKLNSNSKGKYVNVEAVFSNDFVRFKLFEKTITVKFVSLFKISLCRSHISRSRSRISQLLQLHKNYTVLEGLRSSDFLKCTVVKYSRY
jgi:hypothetical protein